MKNKCYFCGNNKKLTKHHIIPRGIGGYNSEKNKETICDKCHKRLHKLLNPVIDYLVIYIKALQETDAPKQMRKIGFIRTNHLKKVRKK